jgi:hypothetical protein
LSHLPHYKRPAAVAACIAAFAACMAIYTRCNTFPTAYHPDELYKGLAVVEGRHKFSQPLLLTSTTAAAAWITGESQTVQQAVIIGRWTSAAFAAFAVVLLALAAGAEHGVLAAFTVAVAVGSSHRLMVWAHYMKEDTALVFGLGAFLLAATLYWRRPSTRTLAMLGAACGLAIAAKYVGAITIPLAWLMARARTQPDSRPVVKPFVLACLAVLVVTHLPALLHQREFWSDLGSEIRHPLVGHRGVRRPILWASPYWGMYRHEVPWPVLLAGLAWVAVGLWSWRRQTGPRRLALAIPLLYGALLLVSAYCEPRHLLPVVVYNYYFAGLAVASGATALSRRPIMQGAIAGMAAAGLIALSVHQARPVYREFAHDTRETMRLWIAENLTATDKVAAESYAALPSDDWIRLGAFAPTDRLPQRVRTVRYLPDLGSLEKLRSEGFTHVVLAEPAWGRYFDPDSRPTQKHSAEFTERRSWYQRLFAEGELLKEVAPPIPTRSQASPTVRLYRLP